jgi:hypothetical protein
MSWSDGGDGCGGDTICQVEISRELTLQGIVVGRNEYMRTEKHDYDDDADDDALRCVFYYIIVLISSSSFLLDRGLVGVSGFDNLVLKVSSTSRTSSSSSSSIVAE